MRLPSSVVIALLVSAAATAGCALFVVGAEKKSTSVERSQRSSQSVVYLFKAALDSNNVQAATDLMVHASGRRLLAVERYETRDDVERWRRLMSAKPITETRSDTLSATNHRVHVTVDYIKHFVFLTTRLDDSNWYIASISAQR